MTLTGIMPAAFAPLARFAGTTVFRMADGRIAETWTCATRTA